MYINGAVLINQKIPFSAFKAMNSS